MNRRADGFSKTTSVKNIKSGINEVVKRRSGSTTRENVNKVTPSGFVVIDNDTTTLEVTVKKKAKKGVTAISTHCNKTPEKKSSSEGNVFQHSHWGRVLREQNLSSIKKGFQHTSSPLEHKPMRQKSCERNGEKEMIKQSGDNSRKVAYKYIHHGVPCEEMLSSKQSSSTSERKSRERSARSAVSSGESVIVYDKGVQCGGIFDENFRGFNPVRTLAFLMKELEHAIEGEKASKILTDMEQALLRIPIEPGKFSHVDMETMAAKAKLEKNTAKLEATCKTMENLYKSVRKENTSLQDRILELSSLLAETKRGEGELKADVERLRTELNENSKIDQTNKRIINEQNKQISALKRELAEKIEEADHTKLEKEKLSVVVSYTDMKFRKLQEAVKELQENVAINLQGLNDFSKTVAPIPNPNHHSTMLPKPIPTRPTTDAAIAPSSLPWHRLNQDISNVSMPAADSFTNTVISPKSFQRKYQQIALSDTQDDTDTPKYNEKTCLEFVSLADCESDSSTLSDGNADDMKSADEVDTSKNRNATRESNKRKKRIISRTRRSLDNKSKSSGGKNFVRTVSENSVYQQSLASSVNIIDKNAKTEIQAMFDNLRKKSKLPVNLPSPPRNFPNPNFSDSTLPPSITE